METYRLNSKLVENNKEYIIQTTNDISLGLVETEVYVDGILADSYKVPHPEHIKPEEVMSLVQNTHGNKKQEIETLLKAVPQILDTANPTSIMHLGLAFFHKRFYAEAKVLLKQVIAIDSKCHEAFNHLGQVELALGESESALSVSQIAVDIKPEYPDYRNNFGEALLASKMYKNAIMEFQRAIDINLYYSDAYFNYGLTLLMNALDQKDTDLFKNFMTKSHEYFTKASIINPEYNTAEFEKGLIAIKKQNIQDAFSLLKRVRENHKEYQRQKSASYYMKHALHPNWITEKAIVERIRFLQNEIDKNPSYVDLYAELSRCYLSQAQIIWKKGVEYYQRTLDLNPSFSKTKNNLVTAKTVQEELDHAMEKISE